MRSSLLRGGHQLLRSRASSVSPYGYGAACRSLLPMPTTKTDLSPVSCPGFNGDDSRNDERRAKSQNSCFGGSLFAVGAISLSFAASSSTVAAAKEMPRADFIPKEVVLYQYEACPFCNKVKAFLDYHNIPYRVVEVNPWSKKEIKWSDYKKVPILVVDGQQMNDSTGMLDTLSPFLG